MEIPFFTTTASSSATTREEALRWLAIAEKLLAGRDLVGSKSFAARARESDPTLLYADQIIAVAETLLASDKRINNQHEWYSILQLAGHQTRDSEFIAGQYRKLALLLNPQKTKCPFADQAFTLVMNAWSVLSNPSRKAVYDNELMAHLRVSSVSSAGFHPVISVGVSREQVNYLPFERNFQVMQPQPQQQHGIFREQVSQQLPLHGTSRESVSQQLSQQNVSQEQVPQLHLSREQVRQPQQQVQPRQQPKSHPWSQPQPQPTPQPPQQQPQQGKEYWTGNNVTQNFSVNAGTSSKNNDNGGAPSNVHVDGNVDVREEERRVDGPSEDGELSFWTACPYCYYMYEYPTVYEECILRCQNHRCRKAFHGVVIPSPPSTVEGQEAYFCCWGIMPLGVSMAVLERNRGKGNWAPFSPMFTCPQGVGNNRSAGTVNDVGGLNVNKNGQGPRSGNLGGRKSSGPRVYVDEDVFLEYSGSSEEADDDWQSDNRKKKTKSVKRKGTATPSRNARKAQVEKGKNVKQGGSDNLQDGFVLQEGVGLPNANVSVTESTKKGITESTKKGITESTKKGAAPNTRRQSARGKLDLNVEFSNEAEEPVRRVSQANGTGRGEEDIIEGSGFFEGLDEFLSSLPILNVVGDDKVKGA